MKLIELIRQTDKEGRAVGHFNFCNFEILKGIALASKETGLPVIVALSEGERKYLGREMAKTMVENLAKELDIDLYFSADHTKSLNEAKRMIDLGIDMIVADGSAMPFDDNVKFVRDVLDYAKTVSSEVIVEGELGIIGQSSEVLDDVPSDLGALTSVQEATDFVQETGIQILSPAVGNMHGVLRTKPNPKLNLSRIKEIKESTKTFLTLHGASGIIDSDLKNSVASGINVVHFNSDLRIAYKEALADAIQEEEIAPYKYLSGVVDRVKKVVKLKLSLLN